MIMKVHRNREEKASNQATDCVIVRKAKQFNYEDVDSRKQLEVMCARYPNRMQKPIEITSRVDSDAS